MFNNRPKGNDLAKRVSYIYLVISILLIILILVANAMNLLNEYAESRDIALISLVIVAIIYLIYFAVTYYISTRHRDNNHNWIAYIVIAVTGIIVFDLRLAIAIAILLIIAGNDIRKELN